MNEPKQASRGFLHFLEVPIRRTTRLPNGTEHHTDNSTYRAKVPGGWLVGEPSGSHYLTFVPDPEHRWDGTSLP